MEGDITKLQIARKLLLQPLFFSAFKWSAGQISQIVKIFERFHRSKLKKIKGKAKLSLASASLRAALA